MMTAADIERAAAAAYSTYWTSRKGAIAKPWGRLVPHEQERWLRLAAAFLNTPSLDARQCRETYMADYADWSWEHVTPAVATRWGLVLATLRRCAAGLAVAA